ncbi:hypothetical protein [Bradyrhizobium sp. 604_D8_N2_3]|uniref:AbiTii domain-containing protein n=1 Tax=Bradyrhizobium sp. 604_D8_N2_3 TaxID=3240370 RepID=UPI003F27AE09
MSLVDEIIELASSDKEPIGNVLRKCLILESQYSNEAFRSWLDKEMDGYDDDEEDLPSYRAFRAISYGHFIGIAGRSLSSQPLSLHILEKDDYERMKICALTQPASAYEGRKDASSDAQFPWNPALTVKYQNRFFKDSDLVLNRAWQIIPGSVIVGLLETVRNRILRFALDMKKSIANEGSLAISTEQVTTMVQKNIFKKEDWT